MIRARIPVVLLAALLAGCAGTRGREVTFRAVTDTEGVQRVEVEAHSYYFQPNHIVVKAGVPVELIFHNKGFPVPHNLTIEALHVSVGSLIGSDHARFVPAAPGTYPFHCHVDHHAAKGMTGTLVVER